MATKTKTKKSINLIKSGLLKNLIIVLLVGTGSYLLAKKYKSQFIVATINYTPISRFQLNKALNDKYGEAVLDELINQTLIKNLLKQNKIEVTRKEIETEIAKLKDQLGGEDAFNSTLTQYGLTMDKLNELTQQRLGVKKLSQQLFKIEVADGEVADYFTQNKAMFKDKTLEQVKDEIKNGILDQKFQQEFGKWFAGEKQKASIRSFI